jgi:hypothetical protein
VATDPANTASGHSRCLPHIAAYAQATVAKKKMSPIYGFQTGLRAITHPGDGPDDEKGTGDAGEGTGRSSRCLHCDHAGHDAPQSSSPEDAVLRVDVHREGEQPVLQRAGVEDGVRTLHCHQCVLAQQWTGFAEGVRRTNGDHGIV